MMNVLILLPVIVTFVVSPSSAITRNDPDLHRNTQELIESRGFVCETHYITTDDGYILTVYRIVNPEVPADEKKRPVILQHGLFMSSSDWIIASSGGNLHNDPDESEPNAVMFEGRVVDRSIGFDLAKRGYDVWLANSRGNYYATNHTYLSKTSQKFWDFSFDEMIKYDVPATIDYVLEVTGKPNVGFIGHSQGSLIMFGLLSEKSKYNNIVKPFIALGPVANLGNIGSLVKYVARLPLVDRIARRFVNGPFAPFGRMTQLLLRRLCTSPIRDVCSNVLFFANGWSTKQFNMTRLPVFLAHMPAGTSIKNLVHFSQAFKSGVVQKFNYGQHGNLERYGWYEPPEYKLERITNKYIALIHSFDDTLASPTDVSILRSRLQTKLILDYEVPVKSWNHLDFLLAHNTGRYVTNRILEVLATYD